MNTQVPSMQDLLSAGVHFGHQVRRGHPKMKNYIFGARDGVHIIDLAQSEEKLKEATQAAYNLGKDGKVMLVVGTKKQAKEIAKTLAEEVETPYLSEKWVGGFLTNFEEVRRNINKLNTLKTQKEKGELTKYTKKEQLLITRKLEKFDLELGGVAAMEVMPDAIFVLDPVSADVAVKEAIKMRTTLLGLCDTNADPNWFDYAIPANDDGIKSIKLIAETIIRAYGEGKKEAGKVAAKKADDDLKIKEEADKKAAEALANPVDEETAALEEEIEKKILNESERKVE
jgi:small subunit ribosomal protein S2